MTETPQHAGRLGYGDTRHRGLTPEEMGDALPYVDVGTAKRVISVDAGYLHTCALLHTGEVKCWGAQWNSPLDAIQNFGIYDDIGDEPGEMGDALPAYDFGGRGVVALAVNGDSNCAALDDGAVHCWGGSHELDWPIVLPP
ncbi:MAG TPA: RCC1 domain-containing protein [Nannocystaceae bacterium]|nr:RCC1 domain-containing protein [Nannocystaceae bacterium]